MRWWLARWPKPAWKPAGALHQKAVYRLLQAGIWLTSAKACQTRRGTTAIDPKMAASPASLAGKANPQPVAHRRRNVAFMQAGISSKA